MNIIWACLLLAGGLVILARCAGLLVTGAVGLAQRLGVSPFIIGLTIMAMGTSAPEAAAGITAAVRGMGDVAIGDVYGSNIANLALVGGLCALIRPIVIKKQALRREIPAMLLVALLLWPVLHNLFLSRLEGLMLLAAFAVLVCLTAYVARREPEDNKRDTRPVLERSEGCKICNTKRSVLFVIIGLAGLALGADMAVRGAVSIGERIGLSQAVIGLTIIAIGTSLPELATCVAAAVKGHHDITIGNLVGSNIFNTLLVTGTAGVVRPFGLSARLAEVDYWIMVLVSAVFILMATLGRRIGRVDGTLLLAGYAGFLVYLLAYS